MSSMEKKEPKYFKYVILGGGVAAGYAAKEFVEQGIKPGELAVISKERVGPYHRPFISKEYLLSIEDPPDIRVCPPKWYAEQGIELILNTTIVKADLSLKILSAATGTIFKYNVLIIATGCMSTKFSDWGFSKAEPKNVFYLRDICDANRIREVIKAKERKKVVIGGASYINLEIAAAMKMNNFDEVSIHFPEPWCMPTLFRHPGISSFYESYFASKGVEIMAGTGIDEFLACENGELKAVKLSNGRVYDADVFILVLHNIPAATLFYGQVEIEKVGIKTDGHMRTSVPDVYAVGDVATFPSKIDNDFRKVEQVDHARKSAEHAVRVIKATERGETLEPYEHLPHLSSHPFDLSWEFYGDSVGEAVMFGDAYSGTGKPKFGAYWVKDGKIVGTFLEGGTPEENQAIAKVVRNQAKVESMDWLEVEGIDYACNF